MSDQQVSFNPYVVLGVGQSASEGEIQKTFQKRLAEDPGSSMRYRHAYGILKNPDLRRKLNDDLERQIWTAFENPVPVPEMAKQEKKKTRRSFFSFSRVKLWALGGLVIALAFTSYLAFTHESGIVCPDCYHVSVVSSADSENSLRCTRTECAFTYVYDEAEEEEERET